MVGQLRSAIRWAPRAPAWRAPPQCSFAALAGAMRWSRCASASARASRRLLKQANVTNILPGLKRVLVNAWDTATLVGSVYPGEHEDIQPGISAVVFAPTSQTDLDAAVLDLAAVLMAWYSTTSRSSW